jgi:HSP20 family protein
MPTSMSWTGLATLRQEMDRVFDRFFEPEWWKEDPPALAQWAPNLDLSETNDALIVKVDVPGMESKDIQVSLQERLLTIRGEKRPEGEGKDERFHCVERSYGGFVRALPLPVRVDPRKVTAAFKDGVLTIRLPKTAAVKGTAIPVGE